MDALLAAMREEPALQRLQNYFAEEAGEITLAYGLSGTQKHAAFAAAYLYSPKPFVILVNNSNALNEWRENLTY